MDFNGGSNNDAQMERLKKSGGRIGTIVGILFLILIVGSIVVNWFTDYIWMDSLDFGTVFTTILSTKIVLGLAGFILFAIITFVTIYWIKRAYQSHFD